MHKLAHAPAHSLQVKLELLELLATGPDEKDGGLSQPSELSGSHPCASLPLKVSEIPEH